MKIVRQADWRAVCSRYSREHRGASLSDFLDSLKRCGEKYAHNWAEVLISREEALNIRLPAHCHYPSVRLAAGQSVSCAAQRFISPVLGSETAECLDRIRSHKNLDFSDTFVFLEFFENSLTHLDGLHRLLAYAIYSVTQEIPAFVCGLPCSATGDSPSNKA